MPIGESAYVALANITLGSSASSVTFSSIPATYRDLVLVAYTIRSTSEADILLSLNNNTTDADYSRVLMFGNGSTTSSAASASTRQVGYQSSQGVLNTYQFLDYSATDKHKTVLLRWDWPQQYTLAQATRWANTAAINQIRFTDNGGGTFAAGSTFALYGIRS